MENPANLNLPNNWALSWTPYTGGGLERIIKGYQNSLSSISNEKLWEFIYRTGLFSKAFAKTGNSLPSPIVNWEKSLQNEWTRREKAFEEFQLREKRRNDEPTDNPEGGEDDINAGQSHYSILDSAKNYLDQQAEQKQLAELANAQAQNKAKNQRIEVIAIGAVLLAIVAYFMLRK